MTRSYGTGRRTSAPNAKKALTRIAAELSSLIEAAPPAPLWRPVARHQENLKAAAREELSKALGTVAALWNLSK